MVDHRDPMHLKLLGHRPLAIVRIGEGMQTSKMSGRGIASALFMVIALVTTVSGAHGERVVAPSVSPKQITLAAFAEKLTRHLESVGYTNVILIPTDNGIHGSALRNGVRVQINLGESGALNIQDAR